MVNATGRDEDVGVDVEFLPLSLSLVQQIEPWVDDSTTQRFLGGRPWIHRELELLESQVGTLYHGLRVVARHAWVVCPVGSGPIALVGVEVYEGATTDLYIVVAPEERGRGIAARLLSVLDERPELGEVQRFRSAVHLDNQSARRVLAKAGFTVPPDLNQYGELQVERLRVARPAVPAPAPDFSLRSRG